MPSLVVSLGLVAGSSATGTLAYIAQAAPTTSDVAPYVGGGAGVLAVGALVEVLRRLLSGRLIPRETKDYEDELGHAIVAAGQREARAMEHAEHMAEIAERMERALNDVRDELRLLRQSRGMS